MMTDERVRILIADHSPIFRRGLWTVLQGWDGFEVVGEAQGSDEARRLAREVRPDIVVLDLDQSGAMQAAQWLRVECPGARIVALSGRTGEQAATEAFGAGVAGLLARLADGKELQHAIQTVHRGNAYMSPQLGRNALEARVPVQSSDGEARLTTREMEVLRMIAGGLSNKEAAARLDISVRTVETHRANLMRKVGLKSVVDLVKYAISKGLV